VFEGTLALVLMNEGAWFDAPASPVQIVSWIVFALPIYLAISSFTALRNAASRRDISNTRPRW
jgi:hypothetical protein